MCTKSVYGLARKTKTPEVNDYRGYTIDFVPRTGFEPVSPP
jgi:hypothetical protein